MGQQQLLLLVLGIVIVGIAVVAGIQAFSEGKDKAEQDAAITDATRIISDTQAWKLKPGAFGGGSSASGFQNVNLKALGYPVTTATSAYSTSNGCYEMTDGTNATIKIYKLPKTPNAVLTSCTGGSEIATVTVSGPTSTGITWAYATGATTPTTP